MSGDKMGVAKLNIKVTAGKVVPNPKIASVLGSRGVQVPKFCQEVTALTSSGDGLYSQGDVVTIKLTLFKDKSYVLRVQDVSVSDLIKQSLSLSAGSSEPGKVEVSTISMDAVREIAKRKASDMGLVLPMQLDSAVNSVKGTAVSMGVAVLD